MIEGIAADITVFVTSEIDRLVSENILPMLFIVILILFVPICICFTLNITSSMMRYSRLYNEKVDTYRQVNPGHHYRNDSTTQAREAKD